MKITNLKIYDLEESLKASGYPMKTKVNSEESAETAMKRAKILGNTDGGGHDQFLTGITVAFDLTCTNKMWVEAERYRFLSFVSSQSTMHRISKFNVREQYNEYVDERIIKIMEDKVKNYNSKLDKLNMIKENFPKRKKFIARKEKELRKLYLEILYSNPAGFELTARLTTNYRCLKNIYNQRKNHTLYEWREFCEYMKENLPYFKEICLGE